MPCTRNIYLMNRLRVGNVVWIFLNWNQNARNIIQSGVKRARLKENDVIIFRGK